MKEKANLQESTFTKGIRKPLLKATLVSGVFAGRWC